MEVTGPLSRHSWGGMRDESQHHLRGRLRVNRIQNVTIFHLRFLGFPLHCKSPLQKLTVQITPKLINYNYYFKAMNFYCGSANYLPASESQCEPCESSLEPFLRIFFEKKELDEFFLCFISLLFRENVIYSNCSGSAKNKNNATKFTTVQDFWEKYLNGYLNGIHWHLSFIDIHDIHIREKRTYSTSSATTCVGVKNK